MDFNTWNIKINNELKDEIREYILDTDNISLGLFDISKNKLNIIEKLVYDIVKFHVNRLNITDEYYIEYWIKNKNNYINQLHIDCDEELREQNIFEYPILSCVTYLNNSDCPFVLTDINLDKYKYKDFNNSEKINIFFPKTYSHVAFNSINYHGAIDIFSTNTTNNNTNNRALIAINIWKKKQPNKLLCIDHNLDNKCNKDDSSIVRFEENLNIDNYNLSEKVLNFDFYETLLYNTNNIQNVIPEFIKDYLKNKLNESVNTIILYNPEKVKEINFIENKTSLKSIEYEKIQIYEIEKMDISNIAYNRFLQRFIYEKIYQSNICNWIINESENYALNNGGWNTKRHNKYPTTDLPVDKIPSIFNFIMSTFEHIFNKISKSYCISSNTKYDINDMFIVKYEKDKQTSLELHHDVSFLSVNLLLSNTCDFEGGGTFFSDGIISYLEQGDMIVHSGKIKHAGLPITNGTRYLLVAFIKVDSLS
jgi:hypothetical protein